MNRIKTPLIILALAIGFFSSKTQAAQTFVDSSPNAIDIFKRMEQENAARATALQSYASTRKYSVYEPNKPPDASMNVSMSYKAPSTKTFKVTSKSGVGFIHSLVFNRLMDAEQQTAAGKQKTDSSISSANYTPKLLGEEMIGDRDNYVLELTPKKQSQYMMTGKIWVDKKDFAIAKLEGDPVKRVSFVVRKSHVIREYQKIGDFWLPLRDDTRCTILFEGEYILHIDYLTYDFGS